MMNQPTRAELRTLNTIGVDPKKKRGRYWVGLLEKGESLSLFGACIRDGNSEPPIELQRGVTPEKLQSLGLTFKDGSPLTLGKLKVIRREATACGEEEASAASDAQDTVAA